MRQHFLAAGRRVGPRAGRRSSCGLLVALAACLIAAMSVPGASAAKAVSAVSVPAAVVWPKFSTPSVVYDADVTSLDAAGLLTANTLQGVYNGEQHPGRLFLNLDASDPFWIAHTVPADVKVEQLSPAGGEDILTTMLQRFKPFITGAVVDDPANADTVDVASTMAGEERAIVIDPGQVPLINSLRIPVLYTFDPSAFDSMTPAQTYQWAIGDGLLAKSSARVLAEFEPTVSGDYRDYGIALGAFNYWLTSTVPADEAVIKEILAHAPADTPIVGYIPNETPDVANLSSLGDFLNATGTNESVWAAMPTPASLTQPTQAAPIAAKPDTVYMAFVVSDGDNAGSYMQDWMEQAWTADPSLGAVPEGWTVAPGTVDFDPTMLEYYNSHVPPDSELVAGPSGIGYASQLNGAALTRFAQLSGQINRQDDLSTTDSYEEQVNLPQFAAASGVTSISSQYPMAEERMGNTIAIGRGNEYIGAPQDLFCSLDQQSATVKPGQPLFLESLVDAWTETPADTLNIAQQLALAGRKAGINYVFTTPTELALTMQRYFTGTEAGLPASNVQSETGDQVLAKPLVGPAYPANPVQVTGQNVITNPSGASGVAGWTTSDSTSTVTATSYRGQPALHWASTSTSDQTWVRYYPAVQDGQTYTFSADVAGTGQVFLDTYAGADWTSLPVKLTSSFVPLTWTVTIPADAPGGQSGSAPQLQVRDSGAGPVSVFIRNASVAASTSPC
jgi:hypothetical protein